MQSRALYLLIIGLLSSPIIFAQERLTIDSVLHQIDRNNLTLLAYESRHKSARAKAEGAAAQMAPMAGAGTFMVPYPGQSVTEEDKGAIMFSVEQNITNPVKLSRRKEYQLSLAEVEEEGRKATFNELRNQARKLYYRWVVAEKKLDLLRENERILTTTHKLAEIRYPYNKSNLSSIYTAQARLYEVQNMQVMTRAETRKMMYSLNALMNKPTTYQFTVDTTVKINLASLFVSDTVELGQSRSVVRQMERNIQAMELNIKAMKAEAKPDFQLRFDHMANRNPMMPAQFTAMAMISIPIAPWSSKMYKSEVKSMQYSVQAMHNEHYAMVSEIQNMVQAMMGDVAAMRERVDNYENKIIPSLHKAFEINRIAYEENRLELPVLMRSWEELNMTRMTYLDELLNYYLMIADYQKEVER